uniref:Secreted protein n=1 Tax=Anopheles christyi TaxID=43041 RepID=A0A182JSZ0_9DIPT
MKFLTIAFLFCVLSAVCGEDTTATDKEQTTTAATKGEGLTESVETPHVETDDSPKDKPDMSPIDFLQEVIRNAMKRVSSGFKDSISVVPFTF